MKTDATSFPAPIAGRTPHSIAHAGLIANLVHISGVIIESMRFCLCLLMLAAVSALASDSHPAETLRGKLVLGDGQPPAVETAEHQLVTLDGDEPTRQVLGDQRLNGFEVEAKGRFTAPGRFLIDPIHTRALLARQGGKLRMITYWCDTCSIRSFTPGPCVCCQRETTLDLRDPDEH